jgi:phytoene synthase
MQLTNIARDVGEDAERGRVYLPESWLVAAGSSPEEVLLGLPAPGVLATTRRVLEAAERYYASGIDGIRLLPARCRPSILTAALLYREIGRRVLARGGDGVTARARVSGRRKLGLALGAVFRSAIDPALRGQPALPHRAELHVALARAGVVT